MLTLLHHAAAVGSTRVPITSKAVGKREVYPYHYYDEAEGETGTHSFDLTMRLIQLIQQVFPKLNIH
eukprot:4936764-Pyramimonas_sp.AAC.1